MKEDKDSVCKLFSDRMRREGRYEEYLEKLSAVAAATGQRHGQAKWEAMRQMGYVGSDDERRLHQEWIDGEKAIELATTEQATSEAASQAERDFEAALKHSSDVHDFGVFAVNCRHSTGLRFTSKSCIPFQSLSANCRNAIAPDSATQ